MIIFSEDSPYYDTPIQLSDRDLPFIRISVCYKNQWMELSNVLIDTGSATTIVKLDLVEEIGLTAERNDYFGTISGVGGSEFVFFKNLDSIKVNGFQLENFHIDLNDLILSCKR